VFCAQCGGPLATGARVCAACGTPVPLTFAMLKVTPAGVLARPPLISLLALLNFISTAVAIFFAVAAGRGGPSGGRLAMIIALALAAAGVAQLVCGIGQWKLKAYGRTLQIALCCVGLLAIPLGTVASILILVYLHKPGTRLVFSGRPVSEFNESEQRQIADVAVGPPATAFVITTLVILASMAVFAIVAALVVSLIFENRGV